MKKIALRFTYYTDLIMVPDSVFENIHEIRSKFDKWLYDKSNDHGYWVYVEGKKRAVSFDTTAFVRYLNDVYLPDSKESASVLQERVEWISADVPMLFF